HGPGNAPGPLAGWDRDRLAAGVDLYQGVLAGKPGADHWTVTVRGAGAAPPGGATPAGPPGPPAGGAPPRPRPFLGAPPGAGARTDGSV
ncbi:peptidoglycan-binding protein, partial [Streptomyces sp. HSW2009]